MWGPSYKEVARGALAKLDNVLPDKQRREVAWAQQSLLAAIYLENARATYGQPDGAKSPQRSTHRRPLPTSQPKHPCRVHGPRSVNAQRFTEMPRGGHFAALEVPELFASDRQEFFGGFGAKNESPLVIA